MLCDRKMRINRGCNIYSNILLKKLKYPSFSFVLMCMEDISLTFETMTEGQNKSIKETVKKEGPRLLNFIRKRVPETEDAEDVLQDVFYQLVETYRMMKPVEEVTSWLFTVARNKITDLFRKNKPVQIDSILTLQNDETGEMLNLAEILPAEGESPEMRMLRLTVMDEIEEALGELPKEQREIFILHEIEHKSFKEISEITGVSINTLLSRKRYAVLFLRERLRELYKELTTN